MAQATRNTNKAATAIIARYTEELGPIAVLADEKPGDFVKAYVESKGGIVEIPYEVYRKTERLSVNDQQVVVNMYKKATGLEEVDVRQRLSSDRNLKKVPDRLAVDSKLVQKAADEEKNKDTQAHLQALADQQANKELVEAGKSAETFPSKEEGTTTGKRRRKGGKSEAKSLAAKARWARIKAEKQVEQVAATINSVAESEDIPPAAIEEVSKMLTQILVETARKHKQMH